MLLLRSSSVFSLLLFASLSALAEFTLNLSPVSPGAAELKFTRTPGYYYCLESSGSLTGTFAPASGWMMGDGLLATWPLTYPTSPATGGGGTATASSDTFTLYPFDSGKTLVTWKDPAGVPYSALVVQNYATLPPLINVPGSATTPSLFLLVGRIAWSPSYEALDPALLPPPQQAMLSHLTSRYAEVLAAAAGSPGSGVVADTAKQFYRIRRMEADADGDGLDWGMETFILGSNPDEVDTDGDGYEDGIEVANGTDPNDFFNGSPPVITIVDGDGQLAWAGQFDESPLIVRVTNADERGIPNHTVLFSTPFAALAPNKFSTTAVSANLPVMTDDDGYAFVFFRQPGAVRATTVIHAQAQGKTPNSAASVDLWTYSVGGNVNGPNAPDNVDGEWIEGATTEVEAYELTWQDTSNDEVEFVIERSIGGESHWIPVATVSANTTEWRDYALDLENEVYYRVISIGL